MISYNKSKVANNLLNMKEEIANIKIERSEIVGKMKAVEEELEKLVGTKDLKEIEKIIKKEEKELGDKEDKLIKDYDDLRNDMEKLRD